MAQMLPVDPHIAVGHYPIEPDKESLPLFAGRNHQIFTIPANTGGHKASARSAGGILIDSPLNTPVVRNIQLAPGSVVKGGILSILVVAQEEFPIGIDVRHFTHLLTLQRGERHTGNQEDKKKGYKSKVHCVKG